MVLPLDAVILIFITMGVRHILPFPGSIYTSTRLFFDTLSKRLGIETSHYDPSIGARIEALFRPNTKAVFTESPDSHSFEIQDIPAIGDAVHRYNTLVIMNNNWVTPLLFKPIAAGVVLSLMAASKYVVKHSDELLSTLAVNPRSGNKLRALHFEFGMFVGTDDVNLALRFLRALTAAQRNGQIP